MKDPKALAILEDMQFPEIEWFTDNMFDRMIECGIAEQNGAVRGRRLWRPRASSR